MKKIILFSIALLFISANIFAQNNAIDNLFEKYTDNDDFTSVYISGKMFNTITKSNSKGKVDDVLSSLKGMNILTTEKNPKDFFKEAKKKLYSNDYEELMRVKDKGANVLFFVRESDGKIAKELVLLVGESDETVLISFGGNINLDKISDLGKTLNIKGANKLGELKNR